MKAIKTTRRRRVVDSRQNVADTVGPVEHGMSVFAITRGQCSMIDVVQYLIGQIGKASVSVWTWAAGDHEAKAFEWMLQSGQLETASIVIDRSAEHRNTPLVERWRERFGQESVRVIFTHAKIARVWNDRWRFVVRGSMNLNQNPRYEQFDLTEGGPEFELIEEVEKSLPLLPPLSSSRETSAAMHGRKRSWDLKPFSGVKSWKP